MSTDDERRSPAGGGTRRRSKQSGAEPCLPGRRIPVHAACVVLGSFLAVVALTFAKDAISESADRDKPVKVESDRMTADEGKRTVVFEGRVVLTQGTLSIRADRLVVRQDAKGNQHGVATGTPARFRQKRDAGNGYVEGEAERIEFDDDGKENRVQFFESARLRRDNGDDVCGNYISYESRTENFSVQSARDSKAPGCNSRVSAVIMPKAKAPETK